MPNWRGGSRHRSLGRLGATVVVVLVGMAGCVPGASSTPTARTSPSAAPTESSKYQEPPDTSPPSPQAFGRVPPGFGSWTEVLEIQLRMSTAADRIQTAPGADVGLAGIVAAPEARRLVVYWKGRPSDDTMRLMNEIRTDMPIELQPARHSALELSAIKHSVITKPGVVSVSGNVDGSGIAVTVDADVNVADWGISVPITLKKGTRPFLAVCSRQVDCAPFWGGAAYSSNGACTLGFTLWKDQGSYKEDYMLSAGHCAELGDVIKTPPGAYIGDVVADDDDYDTLLIKNPVLWQFDGRIFTGPMNAVSGYNRRVLGSFASVKGYYVCTSGSATGEHCGLKVEDVDTLINTGTVIFSLVYAVNPSGDIAVGTGDSGGPVHIPVAGGSTYAMGTMTAGTLEIPCPAGTLSTKCGSAVYYVDISGPLSYYQMKIATGPGFTWPSSP
jgi:hypothetical protein